MILFHSQMECINIKSFFWLPFVAKSSFYIETDCYNEGKLWGELRVFRCPCRLNYMIGTLRNNVEGRVIMIQQLFSSTHVLICDMKWLKKIIHTFCFLKAYMWFCSAWIAILYLLYSNELFCSMNKYMW